MLSGPVNEAYLFKLSSMPPAVMVACVKLDWLMMNVLPLLLGPNVIWLFMG